MTRDRCEELLVAVRSACAQEGCASEVVVLDDGSRDGSVQRVTAAFPEVTVYRSERPRGLLAQRNFLATVSRGQFIVSIDDDAELPDPRTVARTVADFEAGEDIGAVAIPYRELLPNGQWLDLQVPPSGPVAVIDTFIGTAYAVRRELFLALGGFWEHPRSEEREVCVRMLAAGYLVRYGSGPPLLHRPSAVRSWARKSFNSRRQDVLFAYRHVPASSFAWHFLRISANPVVTAFKIDRGAYATDMLRGYLAGLCAVRGAPRHPLDREIYRLHVRLRRRGPIPLQEERCALSAIRGPTPVPLSELGYVVR